MAVSDNGWQRAKVGHSERQRATGGDSERHRVRETRAHISPLVESRNAPRAFFDNFSAWGKSAPLSISEFSNYFRTPTTNKQ